MRRVSPDSSRSESSVNSPKLAAWFWLVVWEKILTVNDTQECSNILQDTQTVQGFVRTAKSSTGSARHPEYFWTQGGAFWQQSRWEPALSISRSPSRSGSDRAMWKAYLKSFFSVVLVKLPSPHKHCPRTLYMRDHSLIRTTGTLMASQTQTQGCEWFIGNWRRKLFFGEVVLFTVKGI